MPSNKQEKIYEYCSYDETSTTDAKKASRNAK